MKQLLVVLSIAFVAGLSGCKSPCRQLSERQCDCQASSYDRNTCLQRAATNESTFVPTAGDNQRCAELVEQCDCRLIDTPEGKRKCGFARRDACDADRDAGCVEDGGY
ncbi:MAG: hypothetical protein Q8L14_18640 [Myxococcales bacterium]|nr:hypothetical protein [Myxococcales bacterium]